MDVLAATNNKAKLREMREILAGFRVLSMADAGISADIPETGGTFAENALIKADAAWRLLRGVGAGGAPAVAGAVADAAALDVAAQAGGFGPLAALTGALDALNAVVVADDSGLCVDALGGEPGVHSARYAGEGATDAERNEMLLRALDGVPPHGRTARFVCAVAAVFPDGARASAAGACEGRIALGPSGGGGFGYDPIFYCAEARCSLALLAPEAKHAVSHRGRALRQMAELLAAWQAGRLT